MHVTHASQTLYLSGQPSLLLTMSALNMVLLEPWGWEFLMNVHKWDILVTTGHPAPLSFWRPFIRWHLLLQPIVKPCSVGTITSLSDQQLFVENHLCSISSPHVVWRTDLTSWLWSRRITQAWPIGTPIPLKTVIASEIGLWLKPAQWEPHLGFACSHWVNSDLFLWGSLAERKMYAWGSWHTSLPPCWEKPTEEGDNVKESRVK